MLHISHRHHVDGIHVIDIEAQLRENHIQEIIAILEQVYHATEPTSVILDLRGSHMLPIRVLASQIKRCYRGLIGHAPLHLAIVVEPSIIQVMKSVMKTLRNEHIDLFTESESANQWLMMERYKLGV